MKTFADTELLSIKYYSKHPEVYKMADQIVDSYVSTKKRVHRDKYVYAARKLIASLWFPTISNRGFSMLILRSDKSISFLVNPIV